MTTTTHAQNGSLKLRFDVPFAFTVENATFPPGQYEVTQPARWILMVRNINTQSSSFEHARVPHSSKEADGRVRMVFHRYGNEYFLVELTNGSIDSTYDLRESKDEQRLADVSPRPQLKVVSVLASGSFRTPAEGQQ
jgi:hypothetical protein